MNQFVTFCDSASTADAIRDANHLQHVALGAQGSGEQITKTLKELVGKANGGG
jgi:hypothetical protein